MRRVLITATALTAVAVPAGKADARSRCNTKACDERVARKQCKRSKPVPCFRRAALQYGVDLRLLLRIGRCESRLKWWAVSYAGARGPMQFMPGTWRATPYRRHSPHSVKWSPLAAAWLIRTDGVHHWNPSRHCWG